MLRQITSPPPTPAFSFFLLLSACGVLPLFLEPTATRSTYHLIMVGARGLCGPACASHTAPSKGLRARGPGGLAAGAMLNNHGRESAQEEARGLTTLGLSGVMTAPGPSAPPGRRRTGQKETIEQAESIDVSAQHEGQAMGLAGMRVFG